MKKAFFLALAPLLFFGCAQNSNDNFNDPDDPLNLFNGGPAVVVEGGTSEDPLGILQDDEETSLEEKEFLFEKNQECLKHKEQISKKLQEKDSPFGETSLEQIFYSPKQNSCLYVEYSDSGGGYYNRRLFDILDDGYSSNPIDACLAARAEWECEKFDETIKEYKE